MNGYYWGFILVLLAIPPPAINPNSISAFLDVSSFLIWLSLAFI
jgi:hypothetical protein